MSRCPDRIHVILTTSTTWPLQARAVVSQHHRPLPQLQDAHGCRWPSVVGKTLTESSLGRCAIALFHTCSTSLHQPALFLRQGSWSQLARRRTAGGLARVWRAKRVGPHAAKLQRSPDRPTQTDTPRGVVVCLSCLSPTTSTTQQSLLYVFLLLLRLVLVLSSSFFLFLILQRS